MSIRLVRGNTAVLIGAVYAGCDCYFGYPITPANEVMHEASVYFPKLGRKCIQAESEEAAINMVYGAAAAGHRVMTASSGPGMSLKQEGISYIAGAELPAVIVDIQRAGPGLGNIGPEQSCYIQAVKGGGHGNYKCIVLAPNSAQEMCDLTIKAFDLAFKYRTPVVVLADGALGQMMEPITFPTEAIEPVIDTTLSVCGTAETRKNLISSVFLDFSLQEGFNHKLLKKYEEISEKEPLYEEYMIDDAEIVLVSYGISSRISKSAVDVARKEGFKVGLFRPITLFPLPEKELQRIAERGCTFVSVEMSAGQMRDDLKLAINCERPVELVSRYGGLLIETGDIMKKVREIAESRKV
ncbi:MAG: 3-methyl-2-oxobutanoate dehydrogenase subunit VorB [Methanosarcinales archaeon]|jgi:2-oxoisovalerate ferredoxin oxidoreductase alpha subunit|nr:3-methyl-2-oxobutanoate dehydrogenase subunit VorB [Methanosarcinales archaeon]